VLDLEAIAQYESSGIPWDHIVAYTGATDNPENRAIYDALHQRGVRCMISGAPSIDKKYYQGEKDAFNNIIKHGADNIESNIPIEAAKVREGYLNSKRGKSYYGMQEIPLSKSLSLPLVFPEDVHIKRK